MTTNTLASLKARAESLDGDRTWATNLLDNMATTYGMRKSRDDIVSLIQAQQFALRTALAFLEAAEAYRSVTLTGRELADALEFIVPDYKSGNQEEVDELKSECFIEYDDGHSGKGYYCSCAEYPDEGAVKLGEDDAAIAAQQGKAHE